MYTQWLYEAIDMHITVELKKGTRINGTLRGIDRRENIHLETDKSSVIISSTAISLLILPKEIRLIMGH
ncbi:hypothetical protein NEAUS03_2421 [Nematocida ausubeli]|uniref:Sm domain-containing protein n=1 Tax=Nematocida ausubeli (strain ATCC PRA-371 / ERTm2) TaxID=1913371 RepID=H8ZBC9_NEMA1|nr:hypothetical protein NERG_00878 [Nematocida ausubeli]KAI5137126.1 hypothetical protein NEAUS06_2104 [Nematocida ausubeli]KAI5137149.1 hypothetical protein NEAUS06_2114 [Nematocida ausubeli]KAI5164069.1 hypothetical protein NEAUS03_2421 [Nematocida ausubeli]